MSARDQEIMQPMSRPGHLSFFLSLSLFLFSKNSADPIGRDLRLICKYRGKFFNFSIHVIRPRQGSQSRSRPVFAQLSGWTANFCARGARVEDADESQRVRKGTRRPPRRRRPCIQGTVSRSRDRRPDGSYSNSAELIGIVCRRHREPLALARSRAHPVRTLFGEPSSPNAEKSCTDQPRLRCN